MGGPRALVVAHEREHSAAEGFRPADRARFAHLGEGPARQHRRRIRFDGPMRDEERSGAGIEKRARETREGLSTGLLAAGRVAGRQHHPIGIELQARYFRGGEQAIVLLGRLIGWGQDERGLGSCLAKLRRLTGKQAMRGEMQHTIAAERSRLDRRLGHVLSQHDRARLGAETARHASELVRGVGERTELAHLGNVGLAVTEGNVRALAVTSARRMPTLPGTPTFAEAGVKNFEVLNVTGLVGPAGMDPRIVYKLHEATVRALGDPKVKEAFSSLGVEIVGSTPEEFAAFIKEDLDRWARVIKEANVKVR